MPAGACEINRKMAERIATKLTKRSTRQTMKYMKSLIGAAAVAVLAALPQVTFGAITGAFSDGMLVTSPDGFVQARSAGEGDESPTSVFTLDSGISDATSPG